MKKKESLFVIIYITLIVFGVIQTADQNTTSDSKSTVNTQLLTNNLDDVIRLKPFYKNNGQVENDDVLYYTFFPEGILWFEANSMALYLRNLDNPIRLVFENTSTNQPCGLNPTTKTTNYFLRNHEPIEVESYSALIYKDIWPGIDICFYASDDSINYEYHVMPGANPASIRMRYEGHDSLSVKPNSVSVQKDGELIESMGLVALQDSGNIGTGYIVNHPNSIGVSIQEYDRSKILTINSLLYSTYLGADGHDHGTSIALDSTGNMYVAGWTSSLDFPSHLEEPDFPNGSYSFTKSDCYVMKLNEEGLVFTSFVGGQGSDFVSALALDAVGNIYVAGNTESSDFPVVNAYDTTSSFQDSFVFKLSADGKTLLYSTYIGGSGRDFPSSMAVDSQGCVFVTGTTMSSNFPTVNSYDATFNGGSLPDGDCFVFKLSSTGDELLYSTYYGGPGGDDGREIVIDDMGNAYVTGWTIGGIPLTNPYDGSHNGYKDCFVFKLNSTGNGLVYSTYIGGLWNDYGESIAIDTSDNVYVTGNTHSPDFPTVHAYDDTIGATLGLSDCFLFKMNSTGTGLFYSTFIGGADDDQGQSVVVDRLGQVYLAGITESEDFPTFNAYDTSHNGVRDCFTLKMNATGSSLLYSTFIGGENNEYVESLIIDYTGTAYIVGSTFSSNFPTVNPVDDTYNGSRDVFLYKLADVSDSDGDLISDYNESLYGTDRFLADSDHDNLTDYAELFVHFTDPLANDSDSDALDDYAEVAVYFTDPLFNDSDFDSMTDGWEVLYTLDPLDPSDAAQDLDNDTLTNLGEFQNGTLPNDNDTDSDLMADGWEILFALNPLDPSDAEGDLDSDTLTNLQEYQLGTSPLLSDSDLDAIPDDWEVAYGFDPLDPAVPLIEFLLYNLHITLILVLTGGISIVGFYIMRARIHERRSRREQDSEQEEIQSVINDLEDDAVKAHSADEQDGIDVDQGSGDDI
ncbi:MAG: SBBP repeat-containing protein [Candidatus Thorarchaeota archaeon]